MVAAPKKSAEGPATGEVKGWPAAARDLTARSLLYGKNKYFGKYGFTSKNTGKINATNIDYLEENLLKLPQDVVSKEDEFFSVDLKKLGFNKLLSKGKVINKI